MKMERGLDTGPVYIQFEHRIGPEERAEELEAALGKLAAQHVVETLDGIAAGRLKETEQDPLS